MALAKSLLAAAILAVGLHAGAAGAAERNLLAEEANRRIVLEFYDRFFNRHETEEAARVVAPDYRQHNPRVPDGRAPFVNFFSSFFRQNPHYNVRIVRSATDGDLVYLHVHARRSTDDLGSAVVDIFRVRDGKIVEHWDVIQPVPQSAANQNTMF